MIKVKILFNCTTNIVGGGIKNSAFFIKYAVNDNNINWSFAISKPVYELLDLWNIKIKQPYIVLDDSPSKSKLSRKKLLAFVRTNSPELVYTMAGPAYVRFPVLHIMGISNPYITHTELSSFFLYNNFIKTTKKIIHTLFQLWYSRYAKYFIFQTEEARYGFCKRAFISCKKTAVISNAYDKKIIELFKNSKNSESEIIRILCPAPPHIHKGINFIPSIAKELSQVLQQPFLFILTLDKGPYLNSIMILSEKLGVQKFIHNMGAFQYSEIGKVYDNSDIVFIPSMLETFSATYLEGMAAGKPLIAADKGFAKEICGDAAQYLNPKNAKESASVFAKIIKDQSLKNKLVQNGYKRLNSFFDQQERYNRIVKTLLDFSK